MTMKYLHLADWLKENIANGSFRAGSKLLTEEELAEKFSYSRYTVRQAIAALEAEGLVYKIQGSGTYVSDQAESLLETVRPAGSQSNIIGLIMVDNQAHVFPEVFRGISDHLMEKGYLMSVSVTDNDFRKERQAIESILAMHPAGIILEPAGSNLVPYNREVYRRMAEQVPTVFIHSAPTDICPRLSLKGRTGARMLVRHLMENGHTKIGAIYCLDEQTSQSRYAGMLDELYAHGLDLPGENAIWIRRSLADDLFRPEGCLALERMARNVTAIVCHDDRIAYKVIQYLREKNIRVPEDISIVGYDDAGFLESADLGITTIAHPKRAYGVHAAMALIEYINNPKGFDITGYEIEPQLIERESVARAAR